MSFESPDSPWARDRDVRPLPKKFTEPPSTSAIFFMDFLRSRGIVTGRIVDLGCGSGRNAVYFVKSGFEVHALDQIDSLVADLDLHGVNPHCGSVTETWLFGDSYFDLAMDIMCYGLESSPEKRAHYRSELMRVLDQGGYFLLSIPVGKYSQKQTQKEFMDFEIVSVHEGKDMICASQISLLNMILKKKK